MDRSRAPQNASSTLSWEEGGIGDHRRATLITRAGAMHAHDAVVIYPDGNRLRIAEAIVGGVTGRAIIIVIQSGDRVKKSSLPRSAIWLSM